MAQIREANFPAVKDKFKLVDLTEAGLVKGFQRPADIRDPEFKLLLLLTHQNRELQRERGQLKARIKSLELPESSTRDTRVRVQSQLSPLSN